MYLSIDLDFWGNMNLSYPRRFIESILALGVPVLATEQHHYVVDHVNENPSDVLVNVDYHSDICDVMGAAPLTCGTWACFVDWKDKGSFVWAYPESRSSRYKVFHLESGYCHGGNEKFNPFTHPNLSGWSSTEKRVFRYNQIDLSRIIAASFVLSPDFGGECFNKEWLELIKDKRLNYLPAGRYIDRRDEWFLFKKL